MDTAGQPVQGLMQHPKGCLISLTVSPRSPSNRIEIDTSGTIRIRLTAPPVDGAANAGLLKFLAAVLDMPRSRLTIVAGAHARHKRIIAEGVSVESVSRALNQAANV